jgi:hypothetical protein
MYYSLGKMDVIREEYVKIRPVEVHALWFSFVGGAAGGGGGGGFVFMLHGLYDVCNCTGFKVKLIMPYDLSLITRTELIPPHDSKPQLHYH